MGRVKLSVMETGILQKVNHYLNNGFYASVSTDDECDTAKKVLPEHASQTSEKVFLLLAGGTGGHIFPGLAVAEALQQRGFTIHWLGTKEGMEATLVPEHGFPVSFLSVKGVRGKGLKALLMAPWRILKSTVQAISVLRKLKPVAVLGMGGFVAGPGSLAAYLLRIPLIIHEQNAVPGMTNRLAAPMAKKILTGFPHILSGYKKTYYTGNPVRQMIQSGPPLYLHSDHGRLRILVLGGSRGALIINQTMPKALALLDNPPEVIHQCGSDHETVTKKLYQDSGFMVKVIPFVNDMAKAYEWADIVICRSGALTVSELACAGKPSVLIPYPWHKDQQQLLNAKHLADNGAAIIIEQKNLGSKKLAEVIKQISEDKSLLSSMHQAAIRCAKPDAATTIANICEMIAGK